MKQLNVYAQAAHIASTSHVDAEILGFGLCNSRMENAKDAKSRIEALHKNHQFWSILVRDLAGVGNKLPADLKSQLIGLGLWSMRYSTLSIGQDLSLQPLIDVNNNIMDGLRAQKI